MIQKKSEAPKLHYLITFWCDKNYDFKSLLQRVYDTGKYRTVAGQIEEGGKTHGIHLQAYVGLHIKARGKQVLQDFPEGARFEEEEDNQKDPLNAGYRMQTYCIKEKSRISEGFILLGEKQLDKRITIREKGGASTKRKWDEIKELAVNEDYESIPFEYLAKYGNGIRTSAAIIRKQRSAATDARLLLPESGYILELRYQSFSQIKINVCRDRSIKRRHYWLYSPPDYGKTTAIEKMLKLYKGILVQGDKEVYKYWNDWQDTIDIFCIDEFCPGLMNHNQLTTLCNGETTTRLCGLGNGKTNINCIIILSNKTIEECYPFMYEPIYARFNYIDLTLICEKIIK